MPRPSFADVADRFLKYKLNLERRKFKDYAYEVSAIGYGGKRAVFRFYELREAVDWLHGYERLLPYRIQHRLENLALTKENDAEAIGLECLHNEVFSDNPRPTPTRDRFVRLQEEAQSHGFSLELSDDSLVLTYNKPSSVILANLDQVEKDIFYYVSIGYGNNNCSKTR